MSATYCVQCPIVMLHNARTVKFFTSVFAFDGYVGQLRASGFVVLFEGPFVAVAARKVAA